MTDTDLNLLRWTAERMKHEYQKRRDNQWHDASSMNLIRYRINRLDSFINYCDLHKRFRP